MRPSHEWVAVVSIGCMGLVLAAFAAGMLVAAWWMHQGAPIIYELKERGTDSLLGYYAEPEDAVAAVLAHLTNGRLVYELQLNLQQLRAPDSCTQLAGEELLEWVAQQRMVAAARQTFKK